MRPSFSQGGAKIWGPPAPHMTCCPGSRPATSFLLQRDFIEPSSTLLLHKIGIVKWVKIAQSCPTLCNPMYYMVHEILQARILEWVAFPFFRGSSQYRDRTQVTCIAGGFFTSLTSREAHNWQITMHECRVYNVLIWYIYMKVKVKVTQSCLTLWNPMNSTVHGILQASILEWVAIPFSSGSSQPRNRTRVSCIAGRFFTSRATREAHNWHITMHECRVYVLIWYIYILQYKYHCNTN